MRFGNAAWRTPNLSLHPLLAVAGHGERDLIDVVEYMLEMVRQSFGALPHE
jgi:hypothetical protein